MTKFYNTDTDQIVDYAGLKVLYPGGSWPVDVNNGGVDGRIADNSPLIPTYPGIQYWERLYVVAAPSVKLYEIAELDALPVQDSAGLWHESWTVRSRTEPEMLFINIQVANELKNQREMKRSEALTDGVHYFDATQATQDSIVRLKNYLMDEGTDSSTVWKGTDDPSTGLPRWSVVKCEDLQEMSVVATGFEQLAFRAEKDTMDAHMLNYFDYMTDVIAAYHDTYNNL